MFDADQPAFRRLRAIYAEQTAQIVAWVGSGLSVPAGLPTWPDLRNALAADALAQAQPLAESERERRVQAIKSISTIDDHWVALERLSDVLGNTSYTAAVRAYLTPRVTDLSPDLYTAIWRLRISGMLTLNLDRLAAAGFAIARPSVVVNEFAGRDAPRYLHLLKTQSPFIVNLHGVISDASSWVLTKSVMARLIGDPGYRTFISSVFASRTVVFIGIGAHDASAGGFLALLKKADVDTGSHFWITTRQDAASEVWAEEVGLQTIRYSATNRAELLDLLAGLASFVSKDDEAPPVAAPSVSTLPSLAAPSSLSRDEPESIRQVLNAHAAKILEPRTSESIEKYDAFCAEYEQAIYYSWYVSRTPPGNIIFGYRVLDELGEGAFGHVFKAEAGDGSIVAIKLLRHEVRGSPNMLGSFRRGVRSMRILSEAGVAGMVPYLEAYELPPCVVMQFVEGPNLEAAVSSRTLDWHDKLRIAESLVTTVKAGHMLPQRVLHRDVRPANIMLEHYYTEPGNWRVVVLDFDLSWHRDALEHSIKLSAAQALGYAAPEQLGGLGGSSTRNALVDSFGIGMTLFFLFSGRHPSMGEYQRNNWPEVVSQSIPTQGIGWLSLRPRLARLITQATAIKQSDRIDAGQIEAELGRLRGCATDPPNVPYAELWTEELLAHIYGPGEYRWSVDTLSGEAMVQSGIVARFEADELRHRIRLKLSWATAGNEERKRIVKFLDRAVDQGVATLRRNGWSIEHRRISYGTLDVAADIAVASIRTNVEGAARAVREAMQKLHL